VPTFLAAQYDALSGQVSRRCDENRRPQESAALGSAAVESIAQAGEEALLAGCELAGRRFFTAQLG